MNLYKKIILFFKEKIIPNCSNHNKYFRFVIIILGFLFFCLTASYESKERKIWQDGNIFRNGDTLQKIKNIFDKGKIEKYQLEEKNDEGENEGEKEQTFIILKGMFIGIIIFSIILGFKKGLVGISLGVFIGSFVGIWVSILIPSFVYFLEFIFAGKIFL